MKTKSDSGISILNPELKKPNKLDSWLKRVLSYPGCDERDLYLSTVTWKGTVFILIYAPIIIAGILIFAPQAILYIQFGYTSFALYAVSLFMHHVFKRHFFLTIALQSVAYQFIAFYFIIKLGGIPTSGGIVFSNITQTLMVLPRLKIRFSISMFILYSILLVLMVVLKPWLQTPEYVTPAMNSTFYMISTFVMFLPVFTIVLGYIKQQKRFEEREANHLKEMNEVKDRLFTNITHEFRTPLTVIRGMADLIKKEPEQWSETGSQKIITNSNILLRMVNQMLDMAKIEKGAMTVSLVRRDINKLLNYLVELFRSEAINRQIDLIFTSANNPSEMDVDSDKIMHIISNLVSNALKFTPAGGRIEVSTKVVENGDLFLIQVTDSGIGIEKEHLAHLFDRFFRVESGNSRAGTGLGLALTKEMVELLHGTISVESTPGEGTTFRILLPVTRNAKKHADLEDADLIIGDIPQDVGGPAVPQKHRVEPGSRVSDVESEAPLLLIVEDNPDVVQYLRAILKNEYRVEVAGNGNEGFEKALEIIPDIILSDVMMPVMDGIELLEKVKTEIRTSHIPVVMLTAKADVGSRLAGLEKGADVYLAKPFNEKELHVQLKSLIEIRRRLQEHYVSVTLQEIRSGAEASLDDQFMQKVISLMDRNLDNDQFGIAELCDALGMSRAQIYRKFRSLTDKTLHDYLRSYRLRKARELLLTTNLTVSEAAYRTGFKNPAHFSRVFTEEFGEYPSELNSRT